MKNMFDAGKQYYNEPDSDVIRDYACGEKAKCEQVVPASLQERLFHKIGVSDENRRKADRALDILRRHPEFEEFIELQMLISDGVLY